MIEEPARSGIGPTGRTALMLAAFFLIAAPLMFAMAYWRDDYLRLARSGLTHWSPWLGNVGTNTAAWLIDVVALVAIFVSSSLVAMKILRMLFPKMDWAKP